MRRLTWRAPDPYPVTITAAWIAWLFAASTAALADLWRPLVVGALLAAAIVAVAWALGRGDRRIVMAAGSAWLLAIGAWPAVALYGVFLLWRWLVAAMRRRRSGPPVGPAVDLAARVANALGLAGIVVAVLSIGSSGALGSNPSGAAGPRLTATEEAPSIYLVLLDGHPAISTMRDDLDIDPAPLVGELEERGFEVASAARSNYNRTLLTLASTLDMRYVDEIDSLAQPGGTFAIQNRQLSAAINGAAGPRLLRDAGYEIVSIGSTYGEATLRSADQTLTSGSLTIFEEQFLRFTPAGRWLLGAAPGVVAEQHRQSIRTALEQLAASPDGGTSQPRLVLAHVFSPHPPFVFAADGSPRDLPACYPHGCSLTPTDAGELGLTMAEYRSGLADQMAWLHGELTRAIDEIVAADPGAVIVLFSDHGARFVEDGPDEEHFRTLFAARTPGHENLFADDVSPVAILPAMLNAYFGTDLPIPDYRAWWATDEAPLEPTPMELP